MYDIIEPYKAYLEYDCRYAPETVAAHLASLPRIFSNLAVESPRQIDAARVTRAWRYQRWQILDNGIERIDSERSSYGFALKEFLRYLEASGYPVDHGLSDIVPAETNARVRYNGLTGDERLRLREYLVYHVSNDRERRETALLFLLLHSGATLAEVLKLQLHSDGLIYVDGQVKQSGDFRYRDGRIYLQISGSAGAYRQVQLPEEAVHFLNFYLENRNRRSSRLFIRGSGKYPTAPLTERSARQMITRVAGDAGLRIKPELLLEVIRNTHAGTLTDSPSGESAPGSRSSAATALLFPLNQSAA